MLEVKPKLSSIQLPYRGSRNYYHSTDVYDQVINILGAIQDLSIYFEKIMFGPFGMYLVEDDSSYETFAKIICNQNGARKKYFVVADQQLVVPERLDYNEKDATEGHEYSEEKKQILLQLNKNSLYSQMQKCIALNKILVGKLLPNSQGKWVCSRIDMDKVDLSGDLKLKFVKNIGSALVLSDVYVNNHQTGRIYFSLVQGII